MRTALNNGWRPAPTADAPDDEPGSRLLPSFPAPTSGAYQPLGPPPSASTHPHSHPRPHQPHHPQPHQPHRPHRLHHPDAAFWARAVYFLLGAGLLAAWNALITATDYFSAVYPGWHTDRLFTVAYLPVCMVALAWSIRYPDAVSLAWRIRGGYAGFTVCMAAVPLLDALLVSTSDIGTDPQPGGAGAGPPSAPPSAAPASALAAVVACVALVGLCDGFCQGALFGEAAQLPPAYTHAVVSGTASSGLLVCLLRLASKASFEAGGGDPRVGLREGTRLYFAIAGGLAFSCLVAYDALLPRLLTAAGLQERGGAVITDGGGGGADGESAPLLGPPSSAAAAAAPALELELSASGSALESRSGSRGGSGHGGNAYLNGLAGKADDLDGSGEGGGGGGDGAGGSPRLPASLVPRDSPPRLPPGGGRPGPRPDPSPFAPLAAAATEDSPLLPPASAAAAAAAASAAAGSAVWRCLALGWRLCAAMVLVYAVTLSIFPGFLAEDVHSAELGDWYPILLITVFNIADLVGKSVPCLEPERDPRDSGHNPGLAGLDAGRLQRQQWAARGGAGGGLARRLALAVLRPLRHPRGLLTVTLVRGVVAAPAFLMAARLAAPAWAMVALTAVLGFSNGYLTAQLLTMGPASVVGHAPAPAPAPHALPPPPAPAPALQPGPPPRPSKRPGLGAASSGAGPGPAGTGSDGTGPAGAYERLPAAPGAASPGPKDDWASSSGSAPSAGLGPGGPHVGGEGPGGAHVDAHGHAAGRHPDAEVLETLLVLSLVGGLNVGAYLGWLWLLG
ncbi:hypothetical protein HYH03_007742 [Edaphochlamys debaryana]|uniref:Uncharacterized protein n=1 Tax=Edaphochlamys debaryana TaxID=47281 RepID=A0A835Y1C0_9CHLO|nr:hypothetical protein HYH03_007742 [Edaphochlamys debaryana]|eukprot:KAG2494103.1 hypothetical protein HYH03_007742 [Edaphochlamys debaryana]